MFKNRPQHIPFQVVIYCSISFLILVASLLKKDVEYSSLENRSMEYFHWPNLNTIISGEWFEIFETYNLDQVIGRDTMVESNSRLLTLIGKKQLNGMTIYKDGTILQASFDFPRADILDNDTIENVLIPIQNATESYGGQFYYMNKYPRYLYFWNGFPYHTDEEFNDYLVINSDNLQKLERLSIRTVDTYDNMLRHQDEYLFFKTDHHYTYRGAYYSYMSLLETINKYNPDREPLSFPKLYDMRIIRPKGYFWGSLISQVGDRKYDGADYLEYALPDDYPDKIERIESGEVSDMPLIRNSSTVEYGWFMNGDYGNTVIMTHRPDLPNILIIGYSFTDALELLAIYNFNEMHSIDPRSYDGDIIEYIKESKCDYVVLQDVITLDS